MDKIDGSLAKNKIPLSELVVFGPHSPVGLICTDGSIDIKSLNISDGDIELLNRFFKYVTLGDTLISYSEEFSNAERGRLDGLDSYLDIPYVPFVRDMNEINQDYTPIRRIIDSGNEKLISGITDVCLSGDYLIEACQSECFTFVQWAAYHDHLAGVRFALDFSPGECINVLKVAARYSRVNIVKFIRDNFNLDDPSLDRCDFESVRESIMLSGNLEILKSSEFLLVRNTACGLAITFGTLEMVQYLNRNNYPLGSDCLMKAINAGKKDILIWLLDIGTERITDLFDLAARHADLEILDILHDRGVRPGHNGSNVYFSAILLGQPKLIEYLHDKGYPLDESYICHAVRENQLEVLEVLLRRVTIVNRMDYSYTLAVENRLMDALKLLLKYGVKWSAKIYSHANQDAKALLDRHLNLQE